MNNIRILSCFAGFTVSVSLFANIPTKHKSILPARVDQGETTGAVLRVIEMHGATIADAHITVRDEYGRTVVRGNTNRDGLLQFPRLAVGSYAFSVSASGAGFAEFQSFFSVGPDQMAEIEVSLKDRCDIDEHLNCDRITGSPVFVDLIQQNSIEVIAPYPILQKPSFQRPGFFKRLLAHLRHRPNGE